MHDTGNCFSVKSNLWVTNQRQITYRFRPSGSIEKNTHDLSVKGFR